MKMSIRLILICCFVMIVIAGDAQTTLPIRKGEDAHRDPVNAKMPMTGTLIVTSRHSIDPMSVNIREQRRQSDVCSLPNGVTVQEVFKPESSLVDGTLVLSEGNTRAATEIQPEPRTHLTKGVGGIGPTVACDPLVNRLYYGHPAFGYVVAYSQYGQELWRVQMAPFRMLDVLTERPVEDPQVVMKQLFTDKSHLTRVCTGNKHVVVEYRTGQTGNYDVVLHRSGLELGRIGPWDGLLWKVSASRWSFFAGGGLDLRFYIPNEVVEIEVKERFLESYIEHFIAWLMPRPTMREYSVSQCSGRDIGEVKYWLKDSYIKGSSERARSVLLVGGLSWVDEFIKRKPVSEVLSRFNPTSTSWQREFHDALIEAGVDALFVRLAREGKVDLFV